MRDTHLQQLEVEIRDNDLRQAGIRADCPDEDLRKLYTRIKPFDEHAMFKPDIVLLHKHVLDHIEKWRVLAREDSKAKALAPYTPSLRACANTLQPSLLPLPHPLSIHS